jgi:hypothetical protein
MAIRNLTGGDIEMQTFTLAPGDKKWIPGPNDKTQLNIVVDDGQGDLVLAAVDPMGTPIAIDLYKLHNMQTVAPLLPPGHVQLIGNEPNIRGPIDVYGSLAEVGVTGPCSLYLENAGASGTITVSLH